MSDLSDLLEAHRHDDESNRDIADAIGIAPGTVDKYMNGTHGTATERILRGFSDYFKIPIEKLRAANGVPAGERGKWSPPPESDRLSRGQRKALDQLIRSIVSRRPAALQDGEEWSGGWGPGGDEDAGVGGDEDGEQRDQL